MSKTYVIEPTQKKSVIETAYWSNSETGERLEIETGWRWGTFIINGLEEDEIAPDDETVVKNEHGFEVYAYANAELDNTFDGCWEYITLFDKQGNKCDDSDDEENPLSARLKEIEEGNEYGDSYTWMEENGWYDDDSETWIYGPLDVKVED